MIRERGYHVSCRGTGSVEREVRSAPSICTACFLFGLGKRVNEAACSLAS